jgi:prepilin-type processing-associated H-X9-DG protein
MIAIGDSKGDNDWDVAIRPDASGLDWPGDVHDRGANTLFCDGHVEWYLQRTLVNHSVDNPRTHHIRKLWNNDNLP